MMNPTNLSDYEYRYIRKILESYGLEDQVESIANAATELSRATGLGREYVIHAIAKLLIKGLKKNDKDKSQKESS